MSALLSARSVVRLIGFSPERRSAM